MWREIEVGGERRGDVWGRDLGGGRGEDIRREISEGREGEIIEGKIPQGDFRRKKISEIKKQRFR